MRQTTMRIALIFFGALMSFSGLIWVLQGFGVIAGSFMSGNMILAYAGLGMNLLGTLVVIVGIQMGRKKLK